MRARTFSKERIQVLRKVFEDKNGNITIWQSPNTLLYGWALFKALDYLINSGTLSFGFGNLSRSFLFVWAYLELTKGDSLFRQLLGGVVIFGVLSSYFSAR